MLSASLATGGLPVHPNPPRLDENHRVPAGSPLEVRITCQDDLPSARHVEAVGKGRVDEDPGGE